MCVCVDNLAFFSSAYNHFPTYTSSPFLFDCINKGVEVIHGLSNEKIASSILKCEYSDFVE